jgi:hypothetical protein
MGEIQGPARVKTTAPICIPSHLFEKASYYQWILNVPIGRS